MPGTCLSLWPTDACEWSIADIWHWSDLVQRSIYVSLALMLGYTFLVVIRFSRRYRLARHEPHDFEVEAGADFHGNGRALIADLSSGLGTLHGIAYAAPLLGLAGTSYGILAAFSSLSLRSWRGVFVSGLSLGLAATLINTATGVLVAASALVCHNFLRVRIERLATRLTPRGNLTENHVRSSQFAQTLPLKRQFSGFPQFGLLAVPFLTFTFMMFVAFKPYPSPAGLRVRVLPTGDTHASDGSIEQVTVSVFLGTDRTPVFLVNSKEIPFDKLKDSVSRELQGRSERVAYVEGDSNVPWADVADVIDTIEGLHCRVILLTAPPARESGCGGPRSSKHSRCRP